MAYCKNCGTKLDDGSRFCSSCGTEIGVQAVRAEQRQTTQAYRPIVIQTEIKPNLRLDAEYDGCVRISYQSDESISGSSALDAYMMSRRRKKWNAVLLCLFLGIFGAHKFYEGKTALGILYIFTCGLFFVGVVVDLISLLGKPDPYYV